MIIKTNRFIPESSQAITIYPFVLIRPTATDDVVIHELVHIEQFKHEPIVFWFKYLCSKNWRLKYECEAYAKQAKWLETHKQTPLALSKEIFIIYLLRDYSLNFNYDKINAALTKALEEQNEKTI